MKATCPKNPDHKIFITVAHEMHDWEVDENGNFLKDLGCEQVSFGPTYGNIWTCAVCDAEAELE